MDRASTLFCCRSVSTPPTKLLDDLAAAVDGDGEVGGEVVVADAELGAAPEEVDHLGAVEQGLAGDAAPVQAEAADVVLLDDGGAQAELGGADRRDVAAGSGADDRDVIRQASKKCMCRSRATARACALLAGVVGAADEGAGLDVLEAQALADLA